MNNDGHTSQLVDRALLRLSPDVFFHPAWGLFVGQLTDYQLDALQPLWEAIEALSSEGNIGDACQILFICAFQQMRAGDYSAASNNIQRILVLAEQHGLPHVARWATWGAAAVCVRRGWFQEAAEHLEHLHSILSQEREWVLSDVIDVIRRALLSQTQAEITAGQPLSSDAVLSSAFEQMLHWGTPHAVSAISTAGLIGHDGHCSHAAPSPSGTAGFTWRSLWRSIRRIATGKLRLKWVDSNEDAPQPHSEEHSTPVPRAPVILLTPAAVPSLPWPDQPAALDQLPAPGRQPGPDRLLVFNPDQPAVIDQTLAPDQTGSSAEPPALPSITAHLLGTFSFSVNDATVRSWPTGKGRAVFKYMLAHHDQPIPRDVLMDVFWPQAGPEAARNSLNVALHGLRQALKTVTDTAVILFEEGAYCINPEFHIWIDVDDFDRHVQTGHRLEAKGQVARAVAEYEAAVELYQGDFLSGDLYEDWPVLTRERLRVTNLETLDRLSQIYFDRKQYTACITACQQMLARDNCREDAHCLLMQCYCRQEQHHLALRQYQICVDALRTELSVDPAPATTQLYERIRRHEQA